MLLIIHNLQNKLITINVIRIYSTWKPILQNDNFIDTVLKYNLDRTQSRLKYDKEYKKPSKCLE